jgi:HAD superfamily hydrolase (TIGR01509 family)
MNNPARLKGIRAAVFDVFGTLAEIGEKRRPYEQLMHIMRASGRESRPDDAARLMSSNVGLAGVPGLFGIELPAASIAELELDLYAELLTIQLFPETISTLNALRQAGYKIGVCSNLATPYAMPIKLLLPFELDAYAWSFEVGAIKPEPAIYENICASLACTPSEVIMIGDTLEADYAGPKRMGMHAFHLSRSGKSPVSESLRSLDQILAVLE